jgi:hypothetical protein
MRRKHAIQQLKGYYERTCAALSQLRALLLVVATSQLLLSLVIKILHGAIIIPLQRCLLLSLLSCRRGILLLSL